MGLKLFEISKAWKGFQLKDVTLEISDEEYFVLLGPTGAGKTLLLETIVGFHAPDKGKILLNDHDVTKMPPEKRGIGYVPQDCMLFPHLSVCQNVEYGLKMKGIRGNERKTIVNQLLDQMGLKHLGHHLTMSLSGGEKQKVALARVLAIRPKVVLLDEPLTAMDAEATRDLKTELKRINRDLHMTIIHVTHDLMEGFSLADRVAIMRAGQIIQIGEAREILKKPKNEFVAKFFGYENIYKASVVTRKHGFSLVSINGIEVKVAEETKRTEMTICVRPEDISLSLSINQEDSDELNVLRGKVTDYSDQGSIVTATVDAGLHIKAIVTKSSFLEMGLDRAAGVWLSFKPESVKILEY